MKRFVHLSDLHFRGQWPEEIGIVVDQLFLDLASQIQDNPSNVTLLFSGDIVFSGGDKKQYDEFFSIFNSQLDKIGISKARRFVVPGNHDVSQTYVTDKRIIHTGVISQISSEREFNDSCDSLCKDIFSEKFENYTAFEELFTENHFSKDALPGKGFQTGNIGIYCLNSAICSSGGAKNLSGTPIPDVGKLMVDTRRLHNWLKENQSKVKVLMMHHPLEWLTSWSKKELVAIIQEHFGLVLSGHIHLQSAQSLVTYGRTSVYCSAPPLFTRKVDDLGYAIFEINETSGEIKGKYRQWSSSARRFVLGTGLSGNDDGQVQFTPSFSERYAGIDPQVFDKPTVEIDTLGILEAELEEATTCFASMKNLWVDRDLAECPETSKEQHAAIMVPPEAVLRRQKTSVVRAPAQFGLTSLGKYLALSYFRSNSGRVALVLDGEKLPAHETGIVESFEARCLEIGVQTEDVDFIILDNLSWDKRGERKLKGIYSSFDHCGLVILQSVDDAGQIAESGNMPELRENKNFYLWSLSRLRLRELVSRYLIKLPDLNEDRVFQKIIDDIDALNLHRTPHNCLTLLRIAENAYDDSPVNRTEMIGRVLYLLFYEFDKIPRYATRPDIKDCEYALGYFCEYLVRDAKISFTKPEFFKKVQHYCDSKLVEIDIDVLFGFLASERILVRKGNNFEFRFSYWHYFFAAHRMHQDQEFATFILSDERYTMFPEVIEFYTGIDRRREDAVIQLTSDLNKMNASFLNRTGIADDLNPFDHARWSPSDKALAEIEREVCDGVAGSTLPDHIKDEVLDKNYDRSKPYDQAVRQYFKESSLRQMVQAMRGACTALRNSDHVDPEKKSELLKEVITCWMRVNQILVIVSPLLARNGNAAFEGLGFYLTNDFDQCEDTLDRWATLMSSIPGNVISWYEGGIFSKRLGPLLRGYLAESPDRLRAHLVRSLLIIHRPPGWEKDIEKFVMKEDKNSFYLMDVFHQLYGQYQFGALTEGNRSSLKRLAATAIARHDTGVKKPNKSLIAIAEKMVSKNAEKD